MTKTIEQQIAETEKRLQCLKEKSAKQETREKIILGALVLSAINREANKDKKDWVIGLLRGVTREADKTVIEALIKKLAQ